jgi:hypothetical protein
MRGAGSPSAIGWSFYIKGLELRVRLQSAEPHSSRGAIAGETERTDTSTRQATIPSRKSEALPDALPLQNKRWTPSRQLGVKSCDGAPNRQSPAKGLQETRITLPPASFSAFSSSYWGPARDHWKWRKDASPLRFEALSNAVCHLCPAGDDSGGRCRSRLVRCGRWSEITLIGRGSKAAKRVGRGLGISGVSCLRRPPAVRPSGSSTPTSRAWMKQGSFVGNGTPRNPLDRSWHGCAV